MLSKRPVPEKVWKVCSNERVTWMSHTDYVCNANFLKAVTLQQNTENNHNAFFAQYSTAISPASNFIKVKENVMGTNLIC